MSHTEHPTITFLIGIRVHQAFLAGKLSCWNWSASDVSCRETVLLELECIRRFLQGGCPAAGVYGTLACKAK